MRFTKWHDKQAFQLFHPTIAVRLSVNVSWKAVNAIFKSLDMAAITHNRGTYSRYVGVSRFQHIKEGHPFCKHNLGELLVVYKRVDLFC